MGSQPSCLAGNKSAGLCQLPLAKPPAGTAAWRGAVQQSLAAHCVLLLSVWSSNLRLVFPSHGRACLAFFGPVYQLYLHTSQRGSPSITCPTSPAPQGTLRENGTILTHQHSPAQCRLCPVLWGLAGVPQATLVWARAKKQRYI